MNATSALGWSLLHFLWQGTLIALATKLALSMLPRRQASLRYAVAVGALALMPLMVVVSVVRTSSSSAAPLPRERAPVAAPVAVAERAPRALVAMPAEPSATSIDAVDTAQIDSGLPSSALTPSTRPWKQRVDPLLPWIVGAWAVGVVALAARLLASYSAVRRLVRAQSESVSESVQALIARLSERLGVRRVVRVCTSSLTRVPAVAGWLRPVILLPASALTGLSCAQLEAVIAHELAHVRRHDYLVNLLQTLVETLLFYHPAVWWLGARIREEREHCCDDLAVAACGSAPEYAQALLSMEALSSSPELALAFSRGSLVGRIERLLAPSARSPELFPRWIAGLSAVAIVFLFGAACGLTQAAAGREPEEVQSGPARAAQVPTNAGDVRLYPGGGDPAQPLSVRSEWAQREAAQQGYREYWVGHSIAPSPAFPTGILMGRFDHTGGLVLRDGETSITLSGGLMTTEAGNLELPGVPLAPLVNAAPGDVAVLYLWSGTSGRSTIRRIHLATASLPVDLEGLPVLWLGGANDRESVEEALALMEGVQDNELRANLVGVVGAHADSAMVVPKLVSILRSTGHDDARGEATEWLARHPVSEALQALDAAARGDRSADVRREAAESVAEMKFPPAFDVLVALAHELRDPDARREAVESMGQRSDPAAVSTLRDLADRDPDEDVQREAVEALGEVRAGAGLPVLASLARDHHSVNVRREAIETYGEYAPVDEALGFLQDLVRQDRDPEARREAVETLGELRDDRVVGILTAIVEQGDDEQVQSEAVESLGATSLGADVAPLLDRIARNHASATVQREAVETLGDLHDEGNRVLDLLAALAADHPTEHGRAEAVETLEDRMAPEAAIALFERLLRSETSPLVRGELEDAIGELREGD